MAVLGIDSVLCGFFRIFSFFGLFQVRFSDSENGLETVRMSSFVIPILLVCYWINAVAVFCLDRPKTDTISLVSNIIQLALNTLMISVTMVIPVFYKTLAKRTVKQLQDLVANLENLRIQFNYRNIRCTLGLICLFFFMFLAWFIVFDGFVNFSNGIMSIQYWFVTILPSIYMILTLTKAICTLSLVRHVYEKVNKSISSRIPSEDEEERDYCVNDYSSVLNGRISVSKFPANDNSNEFEKLFLQRIFGILVDLSEICHKLETYFGPVFLSTFTTIFVVTSIQLYYCYQIIVSSEDESRGYSIWSLIMCLNTVFINTVLVVSITAICQAISNQSKKASRFMYKLQTMGSKTMSAKEIQTLVEGTHFLPNTVAFSALNFFHLDYSMLCGMVGAITTYLIIYIQFSNVYLVNNVNNLSVRSGGERRRF